MTVLEFGHPLTHNVKARDPVGYKKVGFFNSGIDVHEYCKYSTLNSIWMLKARYLYLYMRHLSKRSSLTVLQFPNNIVALHRCQNLRSLSSHFLSTPTLNLNYTLRRRTLMTDLVQKELNALPNWINCGKSW